MVVTLPPGRGRDRQQAGALGRTVDEHRAGAAETAAAAELGAGQARVVAQVPQERHLAVTRELPVHAVDLQADAHAAPMLTPMRAIRAPPRRG